MRSPGPAGSSLRPERQPVTPERWRKQRGRRLGPLCAAILLLGCGDDTATQSNSEIRRVILISIDTLRADALGSYGNPENPTPNLDQFAEEGVRFETCIAPSPLTLPSHATLLTGLHPLEHGLLVNSKGALSSTVETLAELLRADGWKTGAVVSSAVLHHRSGLDRGFSDYSDDLFSDAMDHTDINAIPSTNARETTTAALDWISSQSPQERLFLFLHYIDPHGPYSPPQRFRRLFDEPYLGEVAYVDAWVGKLAVALQGSGLLTGTLFIITSDHGEALGQHGMRTHGYFLYDEVLRVPLIFAGGGLPAGVVSRDPVGLIDVVPTLLRLLKLPLPPNLSGQDILTDPAKPDTDRALVSVSYEPAITYGWSPLWSLWTRSEKFILAPVSEYFSRDSDPGELENLASAHPERASTLEADLRERAASYLARYQESTPTGLDLATAQQLMALGYAAPQNDAEVSLDDFSGRDPKDMRGVILRMDDYHAAVIKENFERADAILNEIEALAPATPVVRQERSFLFLLRGKDQELLEWLDQMPADFRGSATQRYHRAVALGRLGRREEAMDILRERLSEAPDDSLCRFELAKQLSLNDQPEAAMEEFRELLRSDPRNKAGRLNYAYLLKRSDQRLAAIQQLELLVEMYPSYAKAFRNLGLDLAAIGERAAAIAALERAIELAPNAANRPRTEEIIAELEARS